jgi:hypothetical protein
MATFTQRGGMKVAMLQQGPGHDEAPGAGGAGGFGAAVRQADAVSSTSRLRVRFGSTGMPGPMVVETVTFFR